VKPPRPTPAETVEARKTQMLRGLMELALMRLLRDGPEYGLEILDRLRRDAGLNLAEGTIYPLLHRLETGGAIRSEWRLADGGGRPRRYYALTEQGAMEFEALAAEWRRVSNALNSFLES